MDSGQQGVRMTFLPTTNPYAFGPPRALPSIGTAALLCIASNGELANGQTAANISGNIRTRFKWSCWVQLGAAPSSDIRMSFDDYYQTTNATAETDNGSAIGLAKVGAHLYNTAGTYIASYQPTFSGITTATVTDGAYDFQTDGIAPSNFGLERFPAYGWLNVKGEGNMADSTAKMPVTARHSNVGPIPASQFDQQYVYDPANETAEDITVPGLLIQPVGAAAPASFQQTTILGRYDWPTPAIWGGITSIEAGSLDFISRTDDGSNNLPCGGYQRRAPTYAGIPFCVYALVGNRFEYWNANRTKRSASFKYYTHFTFGSAPNDLTAGTTAAQIMTWWLSLLSDIWASGAQDVRASTTLPRAATTDFCTTLANQTPGTGYSGSPSQKDLLDTALAAAVGIPNQLSGLYAAAALVADTVEPAKWAIVPFSATLSASINSAVITASIDKLPAYGSLLAIAAESGTGDVTSYGVQSISGNGPFAIAWNQLTSNAHTIGATIKGTQTQDGTHPGPAAHDLIATQALLPVYRQFKAIR